MRPRTGVKKGAFVLKQSTKSTMKDDLLFHERPLLTKTPSLENHMKSFGSIHLDTLNTGSSRKSKDKHQKVEETMKKNDNEDLIRKAEKLKNRGPAKVLTHKQRKLLTAAKTNNLPFVKASGFTYFETDVNLKDDKNNTPLYYTAKAGNLEFCQYLTDLHARVNEPCENGNTPLHIAFKSDNEGVKISLFCQFDLLN